MEQLTLLQGVASNQPIEESALVERIGAAQVKALLASGLLLGDDSDDRALACDRASRDVAWWTPALVAQAGGSWTGVDIQARYESGMMPSSEALVEANGPVPVHEYRRRPDENSIALTPPQQGRFDELLASRRTCRNFDAGAVLSASALATKLRRVWGAIGTKEIAPGAIAVKKTSPAGGGMHAVEAYLLVQRAEGLAPGIYHYLPLRHAVEPLRILSDAESGALAYQLVAGQHWFANAPVMVIMTARFDRLFWKYRRHAKAWRVVHLDVGHLSQTMYLSAADLGLGAFVTAAINDKEAEVALGLEPMREGAIALVGFGPRSDQRHNLEMDDLTPVEIDLSCCPGR